MKNSKKQKYLKLKRRRANKAQRQIPVTGFGHRSIGPKKGNNSYS